MRKMENDCERGKYELSPYFFLDTAVLQGGSHISSYGCFHAGRSFRSN